MPQSDSVGSSVLKDTIRTCPVCEHDRAEVIHSQKFASPEGQSLIDGYDVVCCERCGVGFADTPVLQRQFDALYANLSRYAAGPAAHVVDSERDFVRFRDVAAEIDRVVADTRARIVDIGCANGLLLKALAERGYSNLCGIDPSAACVHQAAAVPGVDAFVGSLSKIPETAGRFDVLILSHVLEHVRDVRPALDYLKQFASERATVYAEVPDALRYADFAWSPFQDFNTEHINHFSEVSLHTLLGQCGFTPHDFGVKNILSAPGMPYPAVFGFGTIERGRVAPLCKDDELRRRLQAYVRVSTQLLRDIDGHLRKALAGAGRVIVWGTGELTSKLLVDTVLARVNVVGFVDSNPVNQGRILRGRTIVPPYTLRSGDEIIVVASILHADSIRCAIRELGLANPIVTLTTGDPVDFQPLAS
jgi:SAM-dependent methyltransferase